MGPTAPVQARDNPRLGNAPVSSGEGPSAIRRCQPAHATIAALSVHRERLGRYALSPSESHASRIASRVGGFQGLLTI